MQLADDRDVRRDARGRLVERGEVMQVQHVSVAGSGALQLARPRRDLELVLVVVELGEDPVRCTGTVLEGRMQRRAADTGLEPLRRVAGKRRIEVDCAHVPVERSRITVRALIAP